jgi:hypothetical protein
MAENYKWWAFVWLSWQESNCLFNCRYMLTKFEFKFWPKFATLDLKTTSFHVLSLWHKTTSFERILTLMSAHCAPTRSPTIALPIHCWKLDEIGYKTSRWPTDDRIWITSCALDAFVDHWFGGPKITCDLLTSRAKKRAVPYLRDNR